MTAAETRFIARQNTRWYPCRPGLHRERGGVELVLACLGHGSQRVSAAVVECQVINWPHGQLAAGPSRMEASTSKPYRRRVR